MSFVDGIFYIVVLKMSIVLHEFAHGYVAYLLGDNTAKASGRLTLNPIKHLDPFGSILLPLFLIITKVGFLIGWARPVPYNPANLTKSKNGDFFVAIAGICANLLIVIIFSIIIRLAPLLGMAPYDAISPAPFYTITTIIVLLNIVLAFFNLIPIPPLDGSKVLFSFLPSSLRYVEDFLNRWGIFILIFFILFLWSNLSPAIYMLFHLLTGL